MIEGCPTLFNGFDFCGGKTSVAPFCSQGTANSRRERSWLLGWRLQPWPALGGADAAGVTGRHCGQGTRQPGSGAGSSGERVQGAHINLTGGYPQPSTLSWYSSFSSPKGSSSPFHRTSLCQYSPAAPTVWSQGMWKPRMPGHRQQEWRLLQPGTLCQASLTWD